MFQALYYNRTTKTFHLRDDEKQWVSFQYRAYGYVEDPDGNYRTLDGKKVSPTKQYTYKDPNVYESDVDRLTRVLVDIYYEKDDIPSYQNIVYFDIETEIVGSLTQDSIREALAKITAISLYDNNTKTYFCYILDEAKALNLSQVENKQIIPCSSEKELLYKFLDKWEEIDPTIISGWNSSFFDIPCLYHRMVKIIGKNHAVRLSPLKEIDEGEFMGEKYTKIAGVNHLDYMLLFKKYITKQEPSYKLDDIGSKYVDLGKLDYIGSLDKLFKEDINKFIDYNIRDVEILVALESKMKFIDLTVMICHLCHVPYEQIYLSTSLNEGAILTYLKRKDIISPNKPTTYNPSLKDLKESYAGGYLKDPTPGLYDWVIDLDFSSLYPSIIRSLNIGIETLVGRIVNKDKYDNQLSLKELKEMEPTKSIQIERVREDKTIAISTTTAGKMLDLIQNENWIVSAPGVIFQKNKSSVVCDILSDWFNKRIEYKELRKKAYKSGDQVKGDFYDRYQQAFKILLNSLYGCYAIDSWRYTDGHKILSKAITLTGQRLVQDSIKFTNKWMNEQIGTENVDYIITSDTDSLFISVKDILMKRYPECDINNKKEISEKILIIASEIQQASNKYMGELAIDLFNLYDSPHYFELKQELIIERAYFAGKRRYAQYIINKEGVQVEELDIKGLDLMKSNFPPYFRKFTQQLIKDIMFGKTKNEIDKEIVAFRESIDKVDWKMLLKPTGLKNMGDYIDSPPRGGEIFSKFKLKCPINTRAAVLTNDLLKFKKLDKKYNTFQIGDKMFIAYLKDNPYKIEVLGFNGYDDPPFITEIIDKYIDKGKMFDSILKNKLENLYADLGWGAVVLNNNFNKFFKF